MLLLLLARTFFHASLHKLFQLFKVRSVILWPVGGGPVQRVADFHLLNLVDYTIDEHVVNRILDEKTPRRDAVLALLKL